MPVHKGKKNGKHEMPGGHMMSDKEMEGMMGGKGKPPMMKKKSSKKGKY